MKKMFAALAVLGIRRTEPIDYVLSGEVVLVTEAGEEILRAGDCVGFRCATFRKSPCQLTQVN